MFFIQWIGNATPTKLTKNNAPATRAWLMNIFRQERLRMLNILLTVTE